MRYLVLGNESADMDSIASSLSLSLANGGDYIPLINVPKKILHLRRDVLFVFEQLSIDVDTLYFAEDLPLFLEEAKRGNLRAILVDHNRSQEEWVPYVDQIIDHHADENINYPHLQSKQIVKTGSSATLVAEMIGPKSFTEKIAFLLLAAILLDTSNLQDKEKTTPRDIAAVRHLKNVLDLQETRNFFEVLLEKKEDIAGFSVQELLMKDFKNYGRYGIASLPKGVQWTEDNQELWQEPLVAFYQQSGLDMLMVLEWVGEKKKILGYGMPLEKWLETPLFQELFVSKILKLGQGFILLEAKNPIARKILQPAIHSLYQNSIFFRP